MARGVEIEWTSKDEAVLRGFQKVEQNLDNLARKMDKVEASSKKAVDTTKSGFDAATAKVTGFVAAFTGVGSVMAAATMAAQTLKQEWEAIKRQQQASLDANKSLAQVLPEAYRAAGGMLTPRELETAARSGSAATGASQVKVGQAITEALAARGATNKAQAQEAINAAIAALRFAPEQDPQTIAALAGGTTDLQRRFGVSAEQSIGFLARVGGQARVTSLREQVQNLNPAIGSLNAFGMSPQAAGGLVSVLTGATGDFTGALSSTAAVQLAKQLEDRGFATPEAGIAAMQADPALREAFFKGGKFNGEKFPKATFEAKAYASVRELLTGGSALAQNYADATREVGSFAQGGETYNQMIADIATFSSTGLASGSRRSDTNVENYLIGNTLGARTARARNILAQTLQNTQGIPGLDTLRDTRETYAFEAGVARGVAPEQEAINRLRDVSRGDSAFFDSAETKFFNQQIQLLEALLAEAKQQNAGGAPRVQQNAAAGFGR